MNRATHNRHKAIGHSFLLMAMRPLFLLMAGLLTFGPLCAFAATDTDRLLQKLIKNKAPGFTYDFAGVIRPGDKRVMDDLCARLEQKTGSQVKVVTLPGLEGGQIQDFANRLFEGWGIGEKARDNGLLVLMAQAEREIWIEVGYGLEGAIPDARAGRVIDEIILPGFRRGDFSGGLRQGTVALISIIADEYGAELDGVPVSRVSADSRKHRFSILDILIFIAVAYLAVRHPFLFLMLLSSGRGGGFRGGGFGGGGGGGFGGGMSGGGGAGGRW